VNDSAVTQQQLYLAVRPGTFRISSPDTTTCFFSLDFGNEAKDVEVKVGSEICAVTLVTDAEITCTVERFAVGANLVTMHVTGKGTFVFCKCTNSAFGANRKVVIKLVCL